MIYITNPRYWSCLVLVVLWYKVSWKDEILRANRTIEWSMRSVFPWHKYCSGYWDSQWQYADCARTTTCHPSGRDRINTCCLHAIHRLKFVNHLCPYSVQCCLDRLVAVLHETKTCITSNSAVWEQVLNFVGEIISLWCNLILASEDMVWNTARTTWMSPHGLQIIRDMLQVCRLPLAIFA